jgi:alpha-maltose-1-phosphate synthase
MMLERMTRPAFSADRLALRRGLVVVSPTDPEDPDVMSGGPYRVLEAIRSSHPSASMVWPQGRPLLERALDACPPRVQSWLRHRVFNFEGSLIALEHRWPAHARRAVFRRAEWKASRVEALLASRQLHPELLFGCFVPWSLHGLRPDVPLVYYTDASSYEFHRTYHTFTGRSEGFKHAAEAIEREVMARCQLVGVASESAKGWLAEGYGLPVDRIRVIPMGANVVPEVPLTGVEHLSVPSRDDLRLVLVASDFKRKRTEFTIEVVAALNRRGWKARLTLIGPAPKACEASGFVDCLGALKLSDPSDRVKHRCAMADSHMMLLLSEAEAFGVAPAEAAHFGRPSVVTDVGGLPTVVVDGETGVVVRRSASAEEVADRVIWMIEDRARYRRFCASALARAHSTLNWQAWQSGIQRLIAEALGMPAR